MHTLYALDTIEHLWDVRCIYICALNMVPGIAFITVHIQLAVSKSCQHTGHSTLSSEVDINASNRATTTVIP